MPVSKCSPQMKDAFRGIELRYKLNDIIAELPQNQKFSAEQLEGYLKKQGVSPYEIKASRLFDNFRGDNRTFTASEWDSMNLGEQMFKKRFTKAFDYDETASGDYQFLSYENISLGGKGEYNDSYKVNEFMITKAGKPTNLRHEFGEIDTSIQSTYEDKSQLGWNRVHQDEINGKPTTVLNELQSDWLQAERQGAGTFESKVENRELSEGEKYYKEAEEIAREFTDFWEAVENGDSKALEASELFSKAADLGVTNLEPIKDQMIIADFPMKPDKFHQLMIVDAINESIENGTNRVAIPIQRENELAGTVGVTKFYDSLNKKILPEIRKKLDKQGLKIKLSKEDYRESIEKQIASFIDRVVKDIKVSENFISNLIQSKNIKTNEDLRIFASRYDFRKQYREAGKSNELHIIEVVEKPNNKVRWDVYSLISSLGLTEEAIRLSQEGEEN